MSAQTLNHNCRAAKQVRFTAYGLVNFAISKLWRYTHQFVGVRMVIDDQNIFHCHTSDPLADLKTLGMALGAKLITTCRRQ